MNSTGNDKVSMTIADYVLDFRKAGITVLANMNKHKKSIIVRWAHDVVDQYGVHLKDNQIKINDAASLPYSKENIKIAIKTLLLAYVAKEADEMIDLLKDRYVRLSEFQEIRQEDLDTIYREANELDQEAESRDVSLFPTYHRYMQLSVSEQKILIEEINSLVRGFQSQSKDS
jgi:hypothetical protein